jgi:alpha-glucoside transport system permease protein
MRQRPLVPWMYLAPAIIVMAFFIVYPMVSTTILSFQDRNGVGPVQCVAGQPCWGPFENYRYALTAEIDTRSFRTAWNSFWVSSYGNNVKWIFLMVSGTVILGLLIAVLADRVKYEPLSKAVIFMPMAISFVGAGIIWRFVYDYRPGETQIGLLNAIVTALGGRPVAWIPTPGINTVMLIIVGVWIWTGFCMTILSASLKTVPDEILEAARVDGANEFQVFGRIMVPIIMPTITVVITTMVINTLKLFDIVYVMTGGNYGTQVIANRMYTEMYINYNVGHATAVAVVLVVIILPFVYLNVQRFLAQEASR